MQVLTRESVAKTIQRKGRDGLERVSVGGPTSKAGVRTVRKEGGGSWEDSECRSF